MGAAQEEAGQTETLVQRRRVGERVQGQKGGLREEGAEGSSAESPAVGSRTDGNGQQRGHGRGEGQTRTWVEMGAIRDQEKEHRKGNGFQEVHGPGVGTDMEKRGERAGEGGTQERTTEERKGTGRQRQTHRQKYMVVGGGDPDVGEG